MNERPMMFMAGASIGTIGGIVGAGMDSFLMAATTTFAIAGSFLVLRHTTRSLNEARERLAQTREDSRRVWSRRTRPVADRGLDF